MAEIGVTQARKKWAEILDRVGEGAEITLTRHGVAVAVLLRPDALRHRRAAAVSAEADETGELNPDQP